MSKPEKGESVSVAVEISRVSIVIWRHNRHQNCSSIENTSEMSPKFSSDKTKPSDWI